MDMVATYRWDNGTTTTVTVTGISIEVRDEGPTITGGVKSSTYTAEQVSRLIDEHIGLNWVLQRAAWRAQENEGTQP